MDFSLLCRFFMDISISQGVTDKRLQTMVKSLSILGSTGSIGSSALKVVEAFPDRFRIVGLAAGENVSGLKEQILKFRPSVVSLENAEAARELAAALHPDFQKKLKIFNGREGALAVATCPEADLVLAAISGSRGLLPTLAAIEAGKKVALANKEVLVMAGHLLCRTAETKQVSLLPVDSEHSAIFQSIQGHNPAEIRRIILTASGGPFLRKDKNYLKTVTPEAALNHPRWRMGKKVSIDSATLMNKGLEAIEAKWFFSVPMEKIAVYIHPQSIVHSLVEYRDGSLLGQMGIPDMRIPIAYALSYPERLPLDLPPLDLISAGPLTFEKPDLEQFPCLRMALEAGRIGGSVPAVLNAANEAAVEAFLAGKIKFGEIPKIIEKTLSAHTRFEAAALEDVLAADTWGRQKAKEIINHDGG